MRSVGIVRKIDELGRIVFPIELRRKLNIAIGDPVEIFVEDKLIMLKKYERECVFCGEASNIITFKSKSICVDCKENLIKE